MIAGHAVCADILSVESDVRPRFSLNGAWKCAAADDYAFASAGFNDASWRPVSVPGNLASAGFKDKQVVWCRREFTPPANRSFSHLRLENLMDAGQVWLNGDLLSNPLYSRQFEDTQYGVFDKIWSFDWPEFFNTDRKVVAGRKNVIAVRILNYSPRKTDLFRAHPDATSSGRFGMIGDVYLVSRPDVHIDSFERTPPDSAPGGMATHRFFVLVSNDTLKTRKLTVDVEISPAGGSGRRVFSKSTEKSLAPGGSIFDFSWQAQASFQPYHAVATIRENGTLTDQMGLTFSGVFVKTEGGRLTVNGDAFTIRGVSGNPGLVTAGKNVAVNTITWDWVTRDVELLRRSGANVIHTANPTPFLMDAAARAGMMVIPSMTDANYGETVIALKEYANILFWEITAQNRTSAAFIAGNIAAIDPYRRPVAFAGAPPATGDWGRKISLLGRNAMGDTNALCDKLSAASFPLPAYLSPWGKSLPAGAVYPQGESLDLMRRSWDSCVESGKTQGAIFSPLSTASASFARLRPTDSLVPDTATADSLGWNFREIEADYYTSDAGFPTLTLRSRAKYPLRDIRVYATNGGKQKPFASQSQLDAGRNMNVTSGAKGLKTIYITYTTHRGLERKVTINLTQPLLAPDRFRFENNVIRLTAMSWSNAALLAYNNSKTELQATVTVTCTSKDLKFDKVTQSVTIKPGQSARIPFVIKSLSKTKKTIMVTGRIDFKNNRSISIKSELAVAVK